MAKIIKTGVFQTRAELRAESFNEDDKTFNIAWSTGEKVLRYFGPAGDDTYYEELSLENDHVDLSRLNSGAPFLDTHQRGGVDSVIGVIERAWIDNGIGFATVRFSEREDVAPIVQDVKNRILRNVSVGYSVEMYEDVSERDDEIKTFRAVKWTPKEVSIVPIGADSRAQFRSDNNTIQTTIVEKERKMEKEKDIKEVETRSEPQTVDPQEIKNQERARISEITKLVRSTGLDVEFADDLISRGVNIDVARSEILSKVIAKQPQINNTTTTVVDENENKLRGLEQALLARAKIEKDDPQNSYRGVRLIDAARAFTSQNIYEAEKVVTRAFSSSDFQYLLSNVANKSVQKRI